MTDDEVLADSPLPTTEGLLEDLLWAPAAPRPQGVIIQGIGALPESYLGGGWLGRAHFWPNDRLPYLVRLAPVALFEIQHIVHRIMFRHLVNLVFH